MNILSNINLKDPKSQFILFIVATLTLLGTVFDVSEFSGRQHIPQAILDKIPKHNTDSEH